MPIDLDRPSEKTEDVEIPLVLLLTEDSQLEATLSEALSQSHFLVARNPNEALRMICERGRDLSLCNFSLIGG